ncbi:MAG: DnaJ domain-containing protein [Ectothiorhodospiraceae bacterium]|nr:DnaJ domain-containing protein [Chromatiales bacterium]MCP5153759.1 DnaJ domain-containing protein [Ectothiorhodospiraceae bacterium]
MEFKDYYQTMGLARDATQDDVKRAYRRLARKYHPDVSKEPDAEARFKELQEAHEVLKDPEKRAAYDRLGRDWRSGEEFRPPPGWDSGFEFSGGGFTGGGFDFSDFFESLFGRGSAHGHAHGSARGADHMARIEIDLEDAIRGTVREIELQRSRVDREGRLVVEPHRMRVRIPPGATDGRVIRLRGQGAMSPSGRAGDLLLEVALRPHPRFRVEGRDLHTRLPVAPWEAALGARVEVATLDGRIALEVPAGSQTGRRLRLRGRGLPGEPPGDLYVELSVIAPPARDEAARAAYRKLAEAIPFDARAREEGLR